MGYRAVVSQSWPQGAAAANKMLTTVSRVNNLVRLDPVTGEVEEFPIPFSLGVGNATVPGGSKLSAALQSKTECRPDWL